MNRLKPAWILALGLTQMAAAAQDKPVLKDSAAQGLKITASGYAEVYAQHNFNRPESNEVPAFVYSHHRLNELAVNLLYVKLSGTAHRFRAHAGLAAGTYMNRNLASEPATLQHIWEANAGYQLHPTKQLWLEAGVFLSHIGFEHPASRNCLTLTRSLVADNSPYYESGVKLSYETADQGWYLAALALNGWQRIQRTEGNHTPAFGLQVTRQASPAWKLNYSNFVGNIYPDSVQRWRHYHNFFADYQQGKWEWMLGADLGFEQAARASKTWNNWYTLVAIGRYEWKPHWYAVGRAEYFDDPEGLAAQSRPGLAFATTAFSAGMDAQLNKWLMARAEAKHYLAADAQFPYKNNQFRKQLTNVALGVTMSF